MGRGRRPAAPIAPLTQRPPDFDYLAEHWPHVPGRQVLAVVAGSHAHGLATPASDVDVRGLFLGPARARLGLGAPPAQLHHAASDTVFSEAAALLAQALDGDPNAFDVLGSPQVLATTPAARALQTAAAGLVSRRVDARLRGFARSQEARFAKSCAAGAPDFKAAVRALRALQTARTLLRTGRYAVALAARDRAPLRAIKGGAVAPAAVQAAIARAEAAAARVRATPTLPAEPDVAAAHRVLVALRLADLGRPGAVDAPPLPPVAIAGETVVLAPTTDLLGLAPAAAAVEVRDWLRLAAHGSPDRLIALWQAEARLATTPLGRFLLAQRHHLLARSITPAFAGAARQAALRAAGIARPDGQPADLAAAARRYVEIVAAGAALLRRGDLGPWPPGGPPPAPGDLDPATPTLVAAAAASSLPARPDLEAIDAALIALRLDQLVDPT